MSFWEARPAPPKPQAERARTAEGALDGLGEGEEQRQRREGALPARQLLDVARLRRLVGGVLLHADVELLLLEVELQPARLAAVLQDSVGICVGGEKEKRCV